MDSQEHRGEQERHQLNDVDQLKQLVGIREVPEERGAADRPQEEEGEGQKRRKLASLLLHVHPGSREAEFDLELQGELSTSFRVL